MINSIYDTIWIDYSTLNSVKEGKFYTTMRWEDKSYLFDENGKRILIQDHQITWKNVDKVVMLVSIKSSLLDSVTKDKIYRVFNDETNDERYLIDENGEKVLFDKMIFKYELI